MAALLVIARPSVPCGGAERALKLTSERWKLPALAVYGILSQLRLGVMPVTSAFHAGQGEWRPEPAEEWTCGPPRLALACVALIALAVVSGAIYEAVGVIDTVRATPATKPR